MKAKHFGYIFFLVIIALWIFLEWAGHTFGQIPIHIRLDNAMPCKMIGDKWTRVESFTPYEDYYICGYIRPDVDEPEQIQIRIYEGELGTLELPGFYDDIWVSSGEVHIPLVIYLTPGSYTVQISSGRDILSTSQLVIVNYVSTPTATRLTSVR